MTLLEELRIFGKSILHWFYSLVFLSFFFFIFGLKEVVVFGKNYLLPIPTPDSFSVQIFNIIRYDLLPADVELLVTNPMSAFTSQIVFSILLAFLSVLPFFIYKVILYIQPALLPNERKAVLWSLLPFVILFFSGCAFSYFFIIPSTFKVLYPYAGSLHAVPFFSIDEFTYYIFSLMIAVGLMFLLPLFMAILSAIGIIKADFWKSKWRHASLFFLVFSAIITPDGTGVTMLMLFVPLLVLYFMGYIFAKRLSVVNNQ